MPALAAAAATSAALPLEELPLEEEEDVLVGSAASPAAAAPPTRATLVTCDRPPVAEMTYGPAVPTILSLASTTSTAYRPAVTARNAYSPPALVRVMATKCAVSRLRRRTR